MKYRNPVLPGFYPDPSICTDGEKYYMVCSTFQYFPGVPLFESDNLVNWKQIGNVLTRESQLPLKNACHSGGIFAPTIRYHEGRFYMITTNVTDGGNFIVYTDDIYGEWSEPVWLEMGGIDPSLSFIDGKVYFTGTGADENGKMGILQCEIDIHTGKSLTPQKCIWYGTGGRYLEGPHLYKIGKEYFIMAAEGGTEYGHMEIYAKGKTAYGPFENYPKNPVLTNRNLGGYLVQGCGHGDLIQDKAGNWWMVHLAYRQIDQWLMHHITGRETYLVPVTFDENGWFTAGIDGTTPLEVETELLPEVKQEEEIIYTFENTRVGREWIFTRNPDMSCYDFSEKEFCLRGNEFSIQDKLGSPAFVAIRQQEMNGSIVCSLSTKNGEAGITLYMDEEHHYDFAVRKTEEGFELVKRLCIGDIRHEQFVKKLGAKNQVQLQIDLTPMEYYFSAVIEGKEIFLESAKTKYLSKEVTGGFTGVLIGLYAEKGGEGTFSDFKARMTDAYKK